MSKDFGFVIGRFQPFHNGHKHMIDKALEQCKLLTVFIGSAQESRTERNPLTFLERYWVISEVYEKEIKNGRLVILPLIDAGIGDNPKWGDYVLNLFKSLYGKYPDIYFSGSESVREKWFNLDVDLEIVSFSRSEVDISGTQVREEILKENYSNIPIPIYGIIIKEKIEESRGENK